MDSYCFEGWEKEPAARDLRGFIKVENVEMASAKLRGTHKVVKQREETQMASLQGSRVKILRSLTFFFF